MPINVISSSRLNGQDRMKRIPSRGLSHQAIKPYGKFHSFCLVIGVVLIDTCLRFRFQQRYLRSANLPGIEDLDIRVAADLDGTRNT